MTDQTTPTPEVVPAELTPVQYALLDALQAVAGDPVAPAAEYAGKQLVRMAGEALGYPVRTSVLPVDVADLNISVGPFRVRPLGDIRNFVGVRDQAPSEPWPFKPGTVVRDEEGAEVEWLDAAPVGTVVRVANGALWTRQDDCWDNAGRLAASLAIAQQAPVIVVHVGPEANRG